MTVAATGQEFETVRAPGPGTPPSPEATTYIIGDIHGRFDLLERMLKRIDDDISAGNHDDPQLVFVGDYIDRGDESAEVIARLRELTSEHPGNVTCLMGNHEAMILAFLDDPIAKGKRWLRYGGLQTLASYRIGMAGFGEAPSPDELLSAAAQLTDRLGAASAWLRDLPLTWQSRNLWVVHAAADPGRAMDRQERRALLWGHPDFAGAQRRDGQWVVHGHTVVDSAAVSGGVISVDTGAVYSGRLSAAVVQPNGRIRFLATG